MSFRDGCINLVKEIVNRAHAIENREFSYLITNPVDAMDHGASPGVDLVITMIAVIPSGLRANL